MCLYERYILNPKYLPNEKNKGLPEVPKEYDKYIPITCGKCKECRKEKANEWKIRLKEEMKANHKAAFITLSFAPSKITELKQEIETKNHKGLAKGDIDVNILAELAIRRYTERWRKKYKIAPRHWITTEIGHEKTKRLHLHGIQWVTKENIHNLDELQEEIKKIWQYGNVYVGYKCDNQTINYITKYLTKTDKTNLNYQAKIFTSKGLGKNYINTIGKTENKYQGDKTIQTYRDEQGYKRKLPKYYKQKLWTEKEREELQRINSTKTDIWIDGIIIYKDQQDDLQYRKYYKGVLERARKNNEKLGYGTNKTTNDKYIITELMMTEKPTDEELAKPQTRKIKRREIERTEKHDWDNGEINKQQGTEHNIYGYYIGNLTDNERKRNEEHDEAKEKKISIRTLRLIKKGILTK